MAGYILDQCELTWTPSVTYQFGCWGQALLSENRSLSRLHPASLPKTSGTSSAEAPAALPPPDWEDQLPRCPFPSPEKEGSQVLGSVGAGDRQQWCQGHGGRGHIVTLSARCASELNGECMGWWVHEMPVVAKAAGEMLQMMCSVKHWGTCSVPDSSNLDYFIHVQFGKDLGGFCAVITKAKKGFDFPNNYF